MFYCRFLAYFLDFTLRLLDSYGTELKCKMSQIGQFFTFLMSIHFGATWSKKVTFKFLGRHLVVK